MQAEFKREFEQYAHDIVEAVKNDTVWRRTKHTVKRFMKGA